MKTLTTMGVAAGADAVADSVAESVTGATVGTAGGLLGKVGFRAAEGAATLTAVWIFSRRVRSIVRPLPADLVRQLRHAP